MHLVCAYFIPKREENWRLRKKLHKLCGRLRTTNGLRHGRRKYYVSMQSLFFANFARSSLEVEVKFVRSCAVVLTKSG